MFILFGFSFGGNKTVRFCFFSSVYCCCCYSSAFCTSTNFIVVYFINASTLLTAPHNIIHETHLWLQLIAMTVCYGRSFLFSFFALSGLRLVTTPSAYRHIYALCVFSFSFFLRVSISAGGHRSFCVMHRKAY